MDPDALIALRKSKSVRGNYVLSSKYTWWSFLPRNLFEQFLTKMANMYFLVIMFMQIIPQISISNGQPAMALPLVCIVLMSMIKDGYEDYKRHKEDRTENQALTEIYDRETKTFVEH